MSKQNQLKSDGSLKLKELVNNSTEEFPSLDSKLSDLVGYEGLIPSEYAPIIQKIITKN